jgi:uncharacterized protein YgiM (DUF1202 family)
MHTLRRILAICVIATLLLPVLGSTTSFPITLAQDEPAVTDSAQSEDVSGDSAQPPPEEAQPQAEAPPDTDADGIEDAADTCVDLFNPDQIDSDEDGLGDACDPANDDTVESDDPAGEAPDQADLDGQSEEPGTNQPLPEIDPAVDAGSPAALVTEDNVELEEPAVDAAAGGIPASIALIDPQGQPIVFLDSLYSTGGGISGACATFNGGNPGPIENYPYRCDADDGSLDGIIHGFSLTPGNTYRTSSTWSGCWTISDTMDEREMWGFVAGGSSIAYEIEMVLDVASTPDSHGTGCDLLFPPTVTKTPTPIVTNTPTRTATATAVPGDFPAGSRVKTTASVSLRSGANSSSSRVAVVPSGKTGTITGAPIVAGGYTWYPVTFSGYGSGYMAGKYLSQTSTPPTETPTKTPTTAPGGFATGSRVVTTASVNLRAAASSSGAVRSVIASGTVGTITGPGIRNGNYTWYPISIPGKPSGYVAGSYLKLAPSTPPTRTPTPTKTATPIAGGIPVGTLVQTTTNLNIRSCAGTGCSILVMWGKGEGLRIAGAPVKIGSVLWYPVIYVSGKTGWASGTYLKVSSSLSPTATSSVPPPTKTPTSNPTHTATSTETGTPTPRPGETPKWDSLQVGWQLLSSGQTLLRADVGFNAQTIRELPDSTVVKVNGSPVEADGYLWYPVRVQYFPVWDDVWNQSITGWIPYTTAWALCFCNPGSA